MLDIILKISQIAAAGAAIFMIYQNMKPKALCDKCKYMICKHKSDYFMYECGNRYMSRYLHNAPERCNCFEEKAEGEMSNFQ